MSTSSYSPFGYSFKPSSNQTFSLSQIDFTNGLKSIPVATNLQKIPYVVAQNSKYKNSANGQNYSNSKAVDSIPSVVDNVVTSFKYEDHIQAIPMAMSVIHSDLQDNQQEQEEEQLISNCTPNYANFVRVHNYITNASAKSSNSDYNNISYNNSKNMERKRDPNQNYQLSTLLSKKQQQQQKMFKFSNKNSPEDFKKQKINVQNQCKNINSNQHSPQNYDELSPTMPIVNIHKRQNILKRVRDLQVENRLSQNVKSLSRKSKSRSERTIQDIDQLIDGRSQKRERSQGLRGSISRKKRNNLKNSLLTQQHSSQYRRNKYKIGNNKQQQGQKKVKVLSQIVQKLKAGRGTSQNPEKGEINKQKLNSNQNVSKNNDDKQQNEIMSQNKANKIEHLLKDVKEYNKQNSKAIYTITKSIIRQPAGNQNRKNRTEQNNGIFYRMGMGHNGNNSQTTAYSHPTTNSNSNSNTNISIYQISSNPNIQGSEQVRNQGNAYGTVGNTINMGNMDGKNANGGNGEQCPTCGCSCMASFRRRITNGPIS